MNSLLSTSRASILALGILALIPVAFLAWSLHLTASSNAKSSQAAHQKTLEQELDSASLAIRERLEKLLSQAGSTDQKNPAQRFHLATRLPHVATAMVFDQRADLAYPLDFQRSHKNPLQISEAAITLLEQLDTDAFVEGIQDYGLKLEATERIALLERQQSKNPKPELEPLLRTERLGLAALKLGADRAQPLQLENAALPGFLQLSLPDRSLSIVFEPSLIDELQDVAREKLTSFDAVFVKPILEQKELMRERALTRDLPAPLLGWTLHARPTTYIATTPTSQKLQYALLALIALTLITFALFLATQAMKQQERMLAAKASVIAAITHELKTPVTATRLFAETLQEAGHEPELRSKYLALIAAELQRLDHTIDSFLSFGQMHGGKIELNLSPTHAASVLESAAASFANRRPHAANRLSIQIPEDQNPPSILADSIALAGAILNLIDNAYKYSASDSPIAARLHCDDRYVQFDVEDQGIGIDPKEQKLVFELFYQVSSSGQLATSGCGLGLAIVAFVAQAHGGEVSCLSQPKRGSVFSIKIPRSQALPE